jgi:hypothetical protein
MDFGNLLVSCRTPHERFLFAWNDFNGATWAKNNRVAA